MQMTLKLAVTAEAETADDADDRCGISLKARGHGAHAEEHELTRVLEDRPDNFLALDAELIDALNEIRSGCLRRGLFAFHHARGLLNSSRVSTIAGAVNKRCASKLFEVYFFDAAALFSSPGAITGCRNGIMARSLGPSCSMAFCCSRWRVARKLGHPFSFSSIQAFAKLPLRISARILRISSRVCLVMMRGPAE